MISPGSTSSNLANEYAALDGSATTDKNRRTEPSIRVAQYVRMSTEHQQYSIDNQSIIINDFAKKNGMKIVKTYSDDSKSGLNIEGRRGLQQILQDVTTGQADYEVILVYDISRWGRFQDADQSAYYEYQCKEHNIRVEYCAEMFKNDGSISSVLLKNVKRVMAGEYSRELSTKVFHGQCRLIERGFRQGGMAGFGLRRMLLDSSGNPDRILKKGERKSIQDERVILVHGPEKEVETVLWIYDQFVNQARTESEIAHLLNQKGIKTDLGRPWNRGTVNQILTNEKYIGNNVYNRQSFRLKQNRVKNPPDKWIRSIGAFKGIVEDGHFYKAQGIILARARRYSDDEMITLLAELYKRKGYLSGMIIDQCKDMPASSAYRGRFGNLFRAYGRVGFKPDRDYSYVEINQRLREMHPKVVVDVMSQIEGLGGGVQRDDETDLLTINEEFTSSLVIARCQHTTAGSERWFIRFDALLCPDITIAVRMDAENENIQDYYLFPHINTEKKGIRLATQNSKALDSYRFDTLDFFFKMAKRLPFWRVT
jgi:DNA invertase Pin-like site-specific DNA recombinase